MTAIIALENGNMYDIVKTNKEVLKAYGSNIYISYEESMLLQDLLYGLMLRSGNDAAIVIANHIANSEKDFVVMMNNKAQELDMINTNFNNPHGLDDDTKNYSTAKDMVKLTAYASKNKDYKRIASTKYYQTETDKKYYSWKNRADIVHKYDKLTSAKTGYTPSAGKILSTTATNDNLDLSIFSFNYSYDYAIHEYLYEYMFNKYRSYKILDHKRFKYKYQEGYLYILESFSYPLTEDEKERVLTKVVIDNKKVGTIFVYLDDKVLHQQKIYFKSENNLMQKIIEWFTKPKK